jgi:ATPases with chaperone activity, ATP-binding subunit
VIGKHEIETIICKIARIPPQTVSTDDRSRLATLERDLKTVVFGQEASIEALAAAIKMARSGLGQTRKTHRVILVLGSNGCWQNRSGTPIGFHAWH